MPNKYYHTKSSVNHYIKMAKGCNGKTLIEHLKKYLKIGSSILELGSGPGNDIELLNQYYNTTGSDYSELFIEQLNKRHPKTTFLNLDVRTLNTSRIFDGIYSNKVLQHLSDEEVEITLEKQYQLLNNKGIIAHSFWKGKGCDTMEGIIHNYHTTEELKEPFSQKFKVISIVVYKEMEEADSILIIAKKQIT